MKRRVERLRAAAAEAGLDAVLLTSGVNIRYVSGFTSSDAVTLVTERECILFTDFRYTIQAKEQSPDFALCEIRPETLRDRIQEALARNRCRRCGFEQRIPGLACGWSLFRSPMKLRACAALKPRRKSKVLEKRNPLRTPPMKNFCKPSTAA